MRHQNIKAPLTIIIGFGGITVGKFLHKAIAEDYKGQIPDADKLKLHLGGEQRISDLKSFFTNLSEENVRVVISTRTRWEAVKETLAQIDKNLINKESSNNPIKAIYANKSLDKTYPTYRKAPKGFNKKSVIDKELEAYDEVIYVSSCPDNLKDFTKENLKKIKFTDSNFIISKVYHMILRV